MTSGQRWRFLAVLLALSIGVTAVMLAVLDKAGKPVTKIEYRSRR